MPAKFALGQTVATPAALDLLERQGVEPATLLHRHVHGDWGDTSAEDTLVNDDAVESGERILSAYELGPNTVWIITEWDRSVTTLLLPSEY